MSKAIVNMTPNPSDIQTIHCSQGDTEARGWEFELHNNGEVIDAGGIKEQMVFKSYKGGTEQILPENGAVPVTAPFVGDIKYPDTTRTDQEILYRQSLTEKDGNAKIKNLYGKTLVWNQLVQNGNFVDKSNWIEANATLTVNNNIATMVASATYGNIEQILSVKANHMYFATCDIKLTTVTNFNLIQFRPYVSVSIPCASTTGWQTLSGLFIPTADATVYYPRITDARASGWDAIQIRNCMVIDLTQMGLGVSSPSDFTSLFPKSYYDYCQGAMLSFGGRNVKFNQIARPLEDTTYWAIRSDTGTGSISSGVANITATKAFASLAQVATYRSNIIGSHKYLITCNVKGSRAISFRNVVVRFSSSYSYGDSLTLTTSYQKYTRLYTAENDTNNGIIFECTNSQSGDVINIKDVQIIDLTEMFGLGTEPSAEGFKELFPNDYYDYTASQYMNLGQPVSLKTTGKNLIFKVIEVCNIDSTGKLVTDGQGYYDMAVAYVVKGQQYTFQPRHGNEIMGYFLTEPSIGSQTYDKSRITNGTTTFTAQITGYVAIRLNRPETNAQLEIGTSATSYVDYIEPSTLPIPLDKFPNGMDGINDVRDEKNETGYKKKIGFVVVDGSEDEYWGFQSGTPNQCYHRMVVSATLNNPPSISNYANRVTMYASLTGISYIIYSGELRISDMNGAITDVASLRAWLQAHPLVVAYALQEPLENYSVVDLGTLNWHTGGTNTSGIVRMESSDLRSVIKKPSAGSVPARILCNIYETKSADNTYTKNGAISLNTAGDIDVYDSNYNTSDKVSAFKQAMSGVYLLYEKENSEGFTTATLVTENGEVALANENGVLVGKCNSDVSADAGFIEGKIKLSDEDGDVYSNKIQIHVERSPQ